jgi:hypothetical protein
VWAPTLPRKSAATEWADVGGIRFACAPKRRVCRRGKSRVAHTVVLNRVRGPAGRRYQATALAGLIPRTRFCAKTVCATRALSCLAAEMMKIHGGGDTPVAGPKQEGDKSVSPTTQTGRPCPSCRRTQARGRQECLPYRPNRAAESLLSPDPSKRETRVSPLPPNPAYGYFQERKDFLLRSLLPPHPTPRYIFGYPRLSQTSQKNLFSGWKAGLDKD